MISVFSTYVTSIFLEGVFFLFAGVLISSLIEVFVPGEFIERIVPKNRILGIFISSLTGLLFPVCECGIVPVAARLIKKGIPVSHAITMMLSIPLVNIVVFTSTHFAFSGNPEIAIYRSAGGIIVSSAIGLVISLFIKDEFILKREKGKKYVLAEGNAGGVLLHSSHCGCSNCGADHKSDESSARGFASKIKEVLSHSLGDFFDTGRYFIIGILVTSGFQTVIPRAYFTAVGKTFPVSEFFMAAYAYILSICSQTDAFIARSFSDTFSAGALLCFMISGAMIDIKTTAMMKSIFTKRFIILLSAMIVIFTIIFSFFAEVLMGMGL